MTQQPTESVTECKIVNFMNCDPCRIADNKEPAVMISYWHTGKPEIPLVFPQKDAQDMVLFMLRCFAKYGDKKSQDILSNYF